MANTSISNLATGAAVSATDVLPNVQTAGVGPVKTTAAQLKTFMSASPTLVTPALGTPSSGDFSTGTFTWPTFNQNTTGTAAGLSATLAVASGGTGLTSLASGRVPFGAGTNPLSSSSNFVWDNANSRLGVNVASPGLTLDIGGAARVVSATQFSGVTVANGSFSVVQLLGVTATNDTGICNLSSGGVTRVSFNSNGDSYVNGGKLAIGTTTMGTSKLRIADDSIQLDTAKTPASASATGTAGQICWDSDYIYVCVSNNVWKRAGISTW